MPAKRKGRRRGSRNKGYFWRAARSIWCANDGGRFVPLTDENGERLRDRNCPPAVLKAAYARFELSRPKAGSSSAMTLWELSQAYLAHIERTKGAAATLEARADVLFDLCTGFGRKWRKRVEKGDKPPESERQHSGHGTKPAAELRIGAEHRKPPLDSANFVRGGPFQFLPKLGNPRGVGIRRGLRFVGQPPNFVGNLAA